MSREHVLGLNRRELELIAPLNPRHRMRSIAGDKVAAKRLLAAHGLPVPETFAVLEDRRALLAFDWSLPSEFALKPAGGGRGCGIVVACGREGVDWLDFGGDRLARRDLELHVLGILSGDFSREGQSDIAHFERRMKARTDLLGDPVEGLPDVRIIVCEGRPVLAMTRIPTRESRGKANLHQGAVGVGIDVASGRTRAAVWNGDSITRHPDTGRELVGRGVAGWAELVAIAVESARLSGLGYTGIDLVVDDESGPSVLEINARPGLDIQIANLVGLRGALGR